MAYVRRGIPGLARHGVMSARPSARIRELEAALARANDQIAALEAQVRAAGLPLETAPLLPGWMNHLSGSELAAVLAMHAAFPRPLSNYDLDEVVPQYDRVEDRDVRGMSVLIHKVRKKVGPENVVNVWGRGYALAPEFNDRLKAEIAQVGRQ